MGVLNTGVTRAGERRKGAERLGGGVVVRLALRLWGVLRATQLGHPLTNRAINSLGTLEKLDQSPPHERERENVKNVPRVVLADLRGRLVPSPVLALDVRRRQDAVQVLADGHRLALVHDH
jgi:hypothetical protein